MTEIKFTHFDVAGLTIASNSCDLRRDLHQFVNYVAERTVKRSHRGNAISKTDCIRLAKLMNNPLVVDEVREHGCSQWLDYVDTMAFTLGFVHYDTEGEYVGYSSAELSFPDNYIEVEEKCYQAFLVKSPQDQEQQILNALIDNYSYSDNEFFTESPFSILDGFGRNGCGTAILPTLNFAKSRRILLDVLTECQTDVWYSSASLIQYLKVNHPFFLIPKKPQIVKVKKSAEVDRYTNFVEHRGDRWNNATIISEKSPDSFERVEGRYVERFLERMPFDLGYVEVAYGAKQDPDLFPALDQLKAFRVKPLFLKVMQQQIPSPTVTVQPNFEIHVDCTIYPGQVMAELTPLTDIIAEDTAIILKLQKKKVAAQLVKNKNLDVVAILQHLSAKALPQNVVIELEEWEGHSETFTLYDGFSLWEGDCPTTAAGKFAVEQLAATLRIVRSPNKLFDHLEKAELVPMRIKHGDHSLHFMPASAKTVFPKQAANKPAAKPTRKKVILKKEVMITLYFPAKELLEIFRHDLLMVHCLIEVDQIKQSITFPQKYESEIKKTISRIKPDYQVRLQDMV